VISTHTPVRSSSGVVRPVSDKATTFSEMIVYISRVQLGLAAKSLNTTFLSHTFTRNFILFVYIAEFMKIAVEFIHFNKYRFHFEFVRLYTIDAQITSKCGENKKVRHETKSRRQTIQ